MFPGRVPQLFWWILLMIHASEAARKSSRPKLPLAKSRDFKFTTHIKNVSIPIGQDAEFHCNIDRLTAKGQSLQLVWIRLDTQTVLAIERQLVQNNPRISVMQLERLEFTLRIKNTQPEDSGIYACRINTKPFLEQQAHLDVLVPPVIIAADSTEHVMVKEGDDVHLKCKATGHPTPVISWTREDGALIRSKGHNKTSRFKGASLHIRQITRKDMSTYVCMAANGVPPNVAQRINVKVEFKPHVLVEPKYTPGWPTGNAELRCEVEAYPHAVLYWFRDGNVLSSSEKYDIRQDMVSQTTNQIKITLLVKNLEGKDFGEYLCAANNFYGSVNATANLYETDIPKRGAALRDIPGAGSQQMDQGYRPESKSLTKKGAGNSAAKVTVRWLSWRICILVWLTFVVV